MANDIVVNMDACRLVENFRKSSFLILVLVFDFCCMVSDVYSLDTRFQCVGPLGMETGEIPDSDITASSSFDASNVGPQIGRVRVENQGGAWCPKFSVDSETKEWIQIDLHTPHVITAIETQGRFGNGQGAEFAEAYVISYFRPELNKWIRHRDRNGSEVLKGNINTYLAAKTYLDPPIILTKLRILPYSNYRRTVCMRVEIYGCPLRGGLLSYSMPQGSVRGENYPWNFFDNVYDGNFNGSYLSLGLGGLTDGKIGPANLKDDFYVKDRGKAWIGWKNDSRSSSEPLEITFHFDSIREFNSVSIHTSNQFSEDVQVFRQMKAFFSVSGKLYSGEPITHNSVEDCIFEDPKNVTIKLHHRIGRYVKLHLYWAAKWLLISEITFDSLLAMGNFTTEEELTTTTSITPTTTTSIPTTTALPPPKETFKTKRNESDQIVVHQVHQIPEDISVGASSRVTEEWSASSVAIVVTAVLSSLIAIGIVLVIIFAAVLIRHKLLSKLPGSSQNSLQYGGASVSVVNDGHGQSVDFTSSDDSPAKNLIRSTQLSIATAQDFPEPIPTTNLSSFKGSTSTSTSTFHQRRGSFNDGHRQMAEFYSCSLISTSSPSHITDSCNEYEYVLPTFPRQFSPSRLVPPESCHTLGRNRAIHLRFQELGLPEISRHRLKILRNLGEGTFGTVFVGELEKCGPTDRRLVVVKRMLRTATEKDKLEFLEETRLLSSLKNPHVAEVLGVCSEEPCSVILEFLELGDLCQFLRQNDISHTSYNDKLSLSDLLYIAGQIASGMKYCESRNIVHRDLAARNCVVGRGLVVKISHFASDMDVYASDYYRLDGKTPFPIRWMAYESIFLGEYSTRSDVWSFGVTLWEILSFCRLSPYHSLTNSDVIRNLQHLATDDELEYFEFLEKPPNCPRDIYQLLCDTCCKDQNERPKFWEIHCFLSRKNISFCADMITREIPTYIEAHNTQQYIV